MLQCGAYFLFYGDDFWPITRVVGRHRLGQIYEFEIALYASLDAFDVGSKASIYYRCPPAQPAVAASFAAAVPSFASSSVSCSMICLYRAMIFKVFNEAGKSRLHLIPSLALLRHTRFGIDGCFHQFKDFLGACYQKAGYVFEKNKLHLSANTLDCQMHPVSAEFFDDDLQVFNRLCFELGLVYSFGVCSGEEELLWIDPKMRTTFTAPIKWRLRSHQVWWREHDCGHSALDAWVRDLQVAARASLDSIIVDDAADLADGLRSHVVASGEASSSNNLNSNHTKTVKQLSKSAPCKHFLPQNCLTIISTETLAGQLFNGFQQKKRMMRCLTAGRPYIPGMRILLQADDFPLDVSGVYWVIAVYFESHSGIITQIIELQEDNFPLQMSSGCAQKAVSPIEPWEIRNRVDACAMDHLGHYYCAPDSVSQEKSKALLYVSVPACLPFTRQLEKLKRPHQHEFKANKLTRNQQIAQKIQQGGWHCPYVGGDEVWVTYLYGCCQYPCILAPRQKIGVGVSSTEALLQSCDDPQDPGFLGSGTRWLWKTASGFSMSWSNWKSCFSMCGAFGENIFAITDSSLAENNSSSQSNGKAVSHSMAPLNPSAAVCRGGIFFAASQQSIFCQASGSISLAVTYKVRMQHQSIQLTSHERIVLQTSQQKLQSQSKGQFIFNVKGGIDAHCSRQGHFYCQQNLMISAKDILQLHGLQHLKLKAVRVKQTARQIVISSFLDISLQINDTVIVIKPGMISFFSPQIILNAAVVYGGKVSRLPAPLPSVASTLYRLVNKASPVEPIFAADVFDCMQLRWSSLYYVAGDVLEGGWWLYFDKGKQYPRDHLLLNLRIEILCYVKDVSLQSNIKSSTVLLQRSMSRKAGSYADGFKESLQPSMWQKKINQLQRTAPQEAEYALSFSLYYGGKVWQVAAVAKILWPIKIIVNLWQGGQHWQLQKPLQVRRYRLQKMTTPSPNVPCLRDLFGHLYATNEKHMAWPLGKFALELAINAEDYFSTSITGVMSYQTSASNKAMSSIQSHDLLAAPPFDEQLALQDKVRTKRSHVFALECFPHAAANDWHDLGPMANACIAADCQLKSSSHGKVKDAGSSPPVLPTPSTSSTSSLSSIPAADDSCSVKVEKHLEKYLHLHALAPPIIIHLLQDERLYKKHLLSSARPPWFSPAQIQQLHHSGGKVTLFVHGFDVPFGAFGRYQCMTAAEHEDAFSADESFNMTRQHARHLGVHLDDAHVAQTILSQPGCCTSDWQRLQSAYLKTSSIKQETASHFNASPSALHASAADHADHIDCADDLAHAEKNALPSGAHLWLQHIEYYLNQAAGSSEDLRRYQRLVLIAWPSVDESIIRYGGSMHLAMQAGKQLSEVLLELKQAGFDVSIIAHSLGCGVACVAVDHLYTCYRKSIERLFLWQAALPNHVLAQQADYTRQFNFPFAHSSYKPKYQKGTQAGFLAGENYPWLLPNLWKGVEQITVLYSRYDNVLGPLDLSHLSVEKRHKILDAKPFFSELLTSVLAYVFNLRSVYTLGALFGYPLHQLLLSDRQEMLYQQWRSLASVSPGNNRLPRTFQQYVDIKKGRKDYFLVNPVHAVKALLPYTQYFNMSPHKERKPPPLSVFDGWWHQNGEQIMHQGWRLQGLLADIDRLGCLFQLGLSLFIRRPCSALGYSGPDLTDSWVQQCLRSGRLQLIDESPWCWQHSAMRDPSPDFVQHIFKRIAAQLPGFNMH